MQARPGQPQLKGMRFFADDEDAFGLEDLLQVSCVLQAFLYAYLRPRWLCRACALALVAKDALSSLGQPSGLCRRGNGVNQEPSC